MINEIKKWIKEHQGEICLGTLGFIGYLVLDIKRQKDTVYHLRNSVNTRNYILGIQTVLKNNQDRIIELEERIVELEMSK